MGFYCYTIPPKNRVFHKSRVPHLRDSFIVAKVGIARSATAFFHPPNDVSS
jgi:hypothetical protein